MGINAEILPPCVIRKGENLDCPPECPLHNSIMHSLQKEAEERNIPLEELITSMRRGGKPRRYSKIHKEIEHSVSVGFARSVCYQSSQEG